MATGGDVVTVGRTVWRYTSLTHVGVCAVGKGQMVVRLILSSVGNQFPDVRAVEAWLAETLKTPTTAEHLAEAASARWRMAAEVTASADDHGEIAVSSAAGVAG